jgi:DnaJ family protein C protein 28
MVEDVIREAIERGEFDNLPGKGRPLNLNDDPLLDPMTSIVNRILRDNGLSHPLIEARRTMEAEAEECRNELKRAWRIRQRSGGSAEAWADAVRTFRARVRDFNRQVRIFNLKAPSPVLHGLALDAEEELRRVWNQTPEPAST